MLRDILLQFGPDSSHTSYFIQLHGLVNVGDMILTILCTECGASNAVKVSYIQALIEEENMCSQVFIAEMV